MNIINVPDTKDTNNLRSILTDIGNHFYQKTNHASISDTHKVEAQCLLTGLLTDFPALESAADQSEEPYKVVNSDTDEIYFSASKAKAVTVIDIGGFLGAALLVAGYTKKRATGIVAALDAAGVLPALGVTKAKLPANVLDAVLLDNSTSEDCGARTYKSQALK